MAEMGIYDADSVVLSLNGADIVGFAEDFITVEFQSDAFTTIVGATGDVVRSKTSDYRARVTVTLLQTSPSNDILSALHNADRNAPNGAGVVSFSLRHIDSGRSIFTGAQAWVAKMPNVTYSKAGQTRAWLIDVARLEAFVGGSD